MNSHKSVHSYRHIMTTAEFFLIIQQLSYLSPPNKNVFFFNQTLKLSKIFLGPLRGVISLDALCCRVLHSPLPSLSVSLFSPFCSRICLLLFQRTHTHFSLGPFTAVLPSSCHQPWSSQSSVFYFQLVIKLVIFVIILGICFPPAK